MEAHPESGSMTVEDLYEMPDDGYHYELVGGLLVAEPLPGGRHGFVAANVAVELRNFVRERGIGVVLTCDTGFILHRSPDTCRGPDVAVIARERYESLVDATKAVPGPPDLAVEVLSPSNGPAEIRAKTADYLAAGTKLVWVVDPERETVTTYRTLFEPCTVNADGVLTADDVLPGLRIEVATLFELLNDSMPAARPPHGGRRVWKKTEAPTKS